MTRFLLSWLALAAISGCACNPVDYQIGLPPGPELLPVEQELWDTLSPHAKELMLHNAIEWEKYRDKVEARIQLHDESL